MNPDLQKRAVDFLVLAYGRVATHAIWRSLFAHPEIYVPIYHATDSAIQADKLDESFVAAAPAQKLGIILHDESNALLSTTRERVLARFSGDLLIQMVRHPVEMMVSLYNHFVHRSVISEEVAHPGGFDDFISQHENYRTSRFFEIGSLYYSAARRRVLVEFQEMATERIDESMARLYGLIGVDQQFRSAVFEISHQDDISAMMRSTKKAFTLFGTTFNGHLVYSGDSYPNRQDFRVATWDRSTVSLPIQLQDRTIDAVLSAQDGDAGKLRLLNDLTETDRLEIVSVLTTAFLNRVVPVEGLVKSQRIRSASQEQKQKIVSALRDDIDHLYEIYPELQDRWKL